MLNISKSVSSTMLLVLVIFEIPSSAFAYLIDGGHTDDNTLTFFSKTLSTLIEVLEEEAGVALNWPK